VTYTLQLEWQTTDASSGYADPRTNSFLINEGATSTGELSATFVPSR
jgi:hypothetical protein